MGCFKGEIVCFIHFFPPTSLLSPDVEPQQLPHVQGRQAE